MTASQPAPTASASDLQAELQRMRNATRGFAALTAASLGAAAFVGPSLVTAALCVLAGIGAGGLAGSADRRAKLTRAIRHVTGDERKAHIDRLVGLLGAVGYIVVLPALWLGHDGVVAWAGAEDHNSTVVFAGILVTVVVGTLGLVRKHSEQRIAGED